VNIEAYQLWHFPVTVYCQSFRSSHLHLIG